MTDSEIIHSQDAATSNDRLLAALAHGSVVLSFFGALVPALIWSFQRRKSPYAAFHALQAAGYQMLMLWVGTAAYLLFVLLAFLALTSFPGAAAAPGGTLSPQRLLEMQGWMYFFLFGFIGIYFLPGILGAALCLMGRDFKYPILGKRLEKYLGRGPRPNDPLDDAKEEQWMSAMGHASAILLIWGLFTPAALFLAQKDAPRLRFQSAQAALYQIVATVAFFGLSFCYLGVALGIISSLAANPDFGSALSPTEGISFIIIMIVFLIAGILVALTLPTYHLFAMIAGIQTTKGRDYRYPILGRLLAKRFDSSGRPDTEK